MEGKKTKRRTKNRNKQNGDVFYTTDGGVQPLRELRDKYDMEFISLLIDASFKSSKIDNSAFNDCDMPVALFENSNITDCDFSSSLLVGANFDFSTIRRVNMNNAYLKRATFRCAAIKAMLVDDCKLESANFAGAEIDNEQLHLFSRASEVNLSYANIKK